TPGGLGAGSSAWIRVTRAESGPASSMARRSAAALVDCRSVATTMCLGVMTRLLAARLALDNRAARLLPAAEAAGERAHPGVAHRLQGAGGQRRAVAAAAVQDDVGVELRDEALDVALDDALAQVRGAREAAKLPLVVLADIEQVQGGGAGLCLPGD